MHGPRPYTLRLQPPIACYSCIAGRSSTLALESVLVAAETESNPAQTFDPEPTRPTKKPGPLKQGSRQCFLFALILASEDEIRSMVDGDLVLASCPQQRSH